MIKKLFLITLIAVFSQVIFAQQTVKQISKGVVNGSAVSLPKPVYPPAAIAVRAGGEVKIQVLIDEAGTVVSANALSGHPLLRQTAEQAAWQAKFKPTTLEGNPVKVSGTIIYNFVPENQQNANALPEEIWGIGMVFGMLEKADDDLLKQIGIENDFAEMISALTTELPKELSGEKPLIEKLSKSKGAERQKLAGDLAKSLEKYFSEKELEGYKTGYLFGTVIIETIKSAIVIFANSEAKAETSNLKSQLIIFRDKLTATKSHFTTEAAADFEKVAAFADVTELGTAENIRNLFSAISVIMDKISPAEEQETEKNQTKPKKSDT